MIDGLGISDPYAWRAESSAFIVYRGASNMKQGYYSFLSKSSLPPNFGDISLHKNITSLKSEPGLILSFQMMVSAIMQSTQNKKSLL